MLESVLKKEDCARCGFCCSFRRQSLWELPRLPLEFTETHKWNYKGEPVKYKTESNENGTWAVTDLTGMYMTDDPEEEVACPFLDRKRGCTLSGQDKPFECSAWPLRYMRLSDGRCEVCLTPTCPVINGIDTSVLREKVTNGWGEKIRDYAKEHPYVIKDHKEGFIVL